MENEEKINQYVQELEKLVGAEEKSEEKVLEMLTKALADEFLAFYQYWVCKNLARGQGRSDAIPEFEQHCDDEFEHADKLILRIRELGGDPIYDPKDWQVLGNPWTVVNMSDVKKQLEITIQAEKDAIAYYESIIDYCKGFDEITMKLIRGILEDEAQHKYDLEMLKEELED